MRADGGPPREAALPPRQPTCGIPGYEAPERQTVGNAPRSAANSVDQSARLGTGPAEFTSIHFDGEGIARTARTPIPQPDRRPRNARRGPRRGLVVEALRCRVRVLRGREYCDFPPVVDCPPLCR